MGNDEETSSEDSTEEKSAQVEEAPNSENTEEKSDNTSQDDKKQNVEKQVKEEDGEKAKTDELRKVIKVEEAKPSEGKKPGQIEAPTEEIDDTSRDGLEQKRAILQSIKDFDFQIKKNQEEINTVNQKLDSVSKDLDDLVSLYEIVSEQMNPFVGLSKVTKKRIDALENFTKEVESLKTRMGDLESFAEMAGANLDDIRSRRPESGENKGNDIKDAGPSKSIPGSNEGWSNGDVDIIIEKAFSSMSVDAKIDTLIDDFIENLKDTNNN